MRYVYLLLLALVLSACNEKIVQLPETHIKDVTEVLDVSPAYIFYDEVQGDAEFNRKNLISTTNWLVNIDKRLTLKQALPHIIYLQEKRKKASMHKNEAAKNYFSCSNPDLQNLAFIDFTEVQYEYEASNNMISEELKNSELKTNYSSGIFDNNASKGPNIGMSLDVLFDSDAYLFLLNEKVNKLYLKSYIEDVLENNTKVDYFEITPHFRDDLTIQAYIDYKSFLLELRSEKVKISNTELIYN